MEDVKIVRRNLNSKEKMNVYLAVACGCMTMVNESVAGPDHQKKKRQPMEFRQLLLDKVAPLLPGVSEGNMQLFVDTIKASDIVLSDIVQETKSQAEHVLLNLAAFCLEQLPVKPHHMDKFTRLYNLWPTAYSYADTRSGNRIFERIESEMQILVANRGGAIL